MRRSAPFVLGALVASCLGPPAVAPTQVLAVYTAATGPRTRGPYAVVFAGPRGMVENRAEPGVTVLFNRTMRSLDDDETARVPAAVVRAENGADVPGKWRWIGTHGLLFVADAALPGATPFRVTVPGGTRSIDGEALAADYTFSFATPPPRLVTSTPGEGAATLRPDTPLEVTFNQAVEPAQLAKAAHLLVRAGDDAKGRVVPFTSKHPAAVQTASGPDHPERSLLLIPQEPFPRDASVELVIERGLQGEGPLTMDALARVHVRTFGPLRLTTVACPRVFDGALGKCQAHRDLTVSLSNEVMPDEFRSHLSLGRLPRAPPPKEAPAATRKAPRPALAFALGADPDFDRRYHVTLKAGMTDIYGQRLDKDVAFDVDTEAPFSATPAAASRGAPSDEDARPPPLGGASRAVPPFEVGFGLDGYVLEAGPGHHAIPVGLVNIPTFGLLTRKLDVRETKQWLANLATAPGGFLAGGYRFPWESPESAANTRVVRSVDLSAVLAPGSRGTAYLALGTLGTAAPIRQQLVSLTDLGVTAKMSKFGSLVWVTSLATGRPVPSAQVSVGLAKRDDAKTFITDDQGLAAIPSEVFDPIAQTRSGWGSESASPDTGWVFIVTKGDDWTYQAVEESPSFARAAPHVDLGASKEWQGTVFADRGIYRPGETVKLAAVLRQADARGLAVTPGRDVRVTLTDSQGESIYDSRGKLDAFGGLAIDAPLPRTAHLGAVTATLTLPASRASFTTTVLLADFKAAEFAVTARADRKERVRGDRVHFTVHAEYLFHAPMAKAAAHDTAMRSATSFTPKGAEGYVVTDEAFTGDYGDRSPRAGELLEKDAVLDDGGNAEESVDLAMPGQIQPEIVSFESDVEDFTRQVVAGSTSVLVHPAEYYVGMSRPASRFVAVGATVSPRVLALRPDGTHLPGASVKLELVLRKWTTVVEDQGEGARKSNVEDTPVAVCDLVTKLEPASCNLRVPEAGYFIVRATGKDARGNTVRASAALYGLPDRPDVAATRMGWPEGDARVVKLEADRSSYEPGETARVLVRSPFKEATALVTVERGGVLSSQTATLRGPMPTLSIPIQDDYFPNVFVSVHMVRGRVQPAPPSGADVSGPDYRDGYVELSVSPRTHRLDVVVTPDRTDHRPGDDLDADVIVKDAQGKPTKAEVTFYAVDEGVLMLTDYKTPDPIAAFTRPRSLAVFGLESRDHLARILALKAGQKLANLGWETRGNDKGDDGGDGDAGGKARREFRNTAYFEAGRITSDEGRAHFHFKLPDNLTTFRLMAVAAAADRFGSGQANVTAAKRLMVRPALPRAVRVGDRFDASVVVSGKATGLVDVRVSVVGGKLELQGPPARRVTLPPSGNVEVHFPVVAGAPGDAVLTFAATGGGETDTVQVTRAVALPLHLETVAVYGETTRAVAITLGDLSKVRSDEGGLDVRLSSSALVGLDGAFNQLEQYPYGCTEQLASRLIPLVALEDLARTVGVRVPSTTDARLQEAVSEMLAHQHEDGGFGYWDSDAPEPWLSAYAMLALDAVSKRGVIVPASALDGGVEYLRRTLASEKLEPDDGAADDDAKKQSVDEENDPAPVRSLDGLSVADRASRAYAEAAFMADALATVGKPDPGYLNRLFDARARQPLFTQALLLHAMASAAMPKAQTGTLAGEVLARLRVDAETAVAEEQDALYAPLLDSPARTTALVLRALLSLDPRQPLAPRIAKGLLAARKAGAWSSTQENAWALLALDQYRRAQEMPKPDFDVDVFLGRTRIGGEAFHQSSLRDERLTLLPSKVRELGGPLTLAVAGTGTLYYSAQLEYAATLLPAKPLDRGLFVQKTMRAVKLADLAAASQWIPRKTSLTANAGDLVVVDLLLESAEPEEQVVLVDPLPSGLEAVDFDLATTGASHSVGDGARKGVVPTTDALDDLGMAFRETTTHRELKDDRVLTFIPHVAPGLYHFRYLARATVVGTYVVPPTVAQCMYSPDVYGRTRAESFDVHP